MNRVLYLFLFSSIVLLSSSTYSQDTLPKFSVRNIGRDRIIIGWVNNYQQIKQISIQRSFDSLKNYRTILTVPDPTAVQNGFADTKAPNDHMYYRLFIVLGEGSFFFTKVTRPKLDTAKAVTDIPVAPVTARPPTEPVKDTAAVAKPVIKPPIIKKPEFVPSFYVYTNKEGYVFINLPDADQKKYHIRFSEPDGTPLFEIKTIKETALTLDKTNFFHSGWFNFELYNEEKLVEKNKFYIAKDF